MVKDVCLCKKEKLERLMVGSSEDGDACNGPGQKDRDGGGELV